MSIAVDEVGHSERVMSFVRICSSLKVETICWLMSARLDEDQTYALLTRMAKRKELAIVRDDDDELSAMTMKNALKL